MARLKNWNKRLPCKGDVRDEEDRIEKHSEKIVEASDEAANDSFRNGKSQLRSVLVEQDTSDAHEAVAQDGGDVELRFAEPNRLKRVNDIFTNGGTSHDVLRAHNR